MTAETPWGMVFDGPGRKLNCATFARPKLAPGECLVRVLGTTLCGSDLHSYEGRRLTPVPTILGHEILGEIEELPTEPPTAIGGRPLAVGDRVVWGLAASCGECHYCHRDLPQKCVALFKYGHEALRPGRELSGGLASHCLLVRGTAIVRVPDSVPDAVACPAACATATVAGALRVAAARPQGRFLVVGLGMLGLTACAMLRAAGAECVWGVDVDPRRRALATRFGALRALECNEVPGSVMAHTDGRGVDAAFEFTGSPDGARMTLEALDLGGVAVWVGATYPAPPVSVDAETIVRRCLTVRGLHNYHPTDLVAAMEFLASHGRSSPFESVVSPPFPLEQAEGAFKAAATGEYLRVAVGHFRTS